MTEQDDLVRWALPHIRSTFESGSLMHGSEILRFRRDADDATVKDPCSTDREEVLREAAKYEAGSGRMIVITGGTRYEGARAIIADVYDRDTGDNVCLVWKWSVNFRFRGQLKGQLKPVGPAASLAKYRRLP